MNLSVEQFGQLFAIIRSLDLGRTGPNMSLFVDLLYNWEDGVLGIHV